MKIYDTKVSLINSIQNNMNVDTSIITDSVINITINGELLYNYLDIEEVEKKYILLDGPNKFTKLLIYPVETEITNKINGIWNWNLFYLSIIDNYCLIDENSNCIITNSVKYTTLEWFTKILNSKVDWCKLGSRIRKLKQQNKLKIKQKILEDSIDLAFRIIIIGNYGNNDTAFDTSLDGNYVYSINLSSLYLDIYSKIMSCSKRDKNKYLLYNYKNISKTHLGCSVNGFSITELLEYGLLDKLNNYFETFEVIYEENPEKKDYMDIWLTW